MDGMVLCERMLGTRPGMPVIVVAGLFSLEAAVGPMRAGAYDVLTKPLDLNLLGTSVAHRPTRAPADAECVADTPAANQAR